MRRGCRFGYSAPHELGKRDKAYVSEFGRFVNRFLEDHPEVAADQARGREIYWDKEVNLEELKKAQEDIVPPDSYYYFGNPGPREK